MNYPSKFWGSDAQFILHDKDKRLLKKYNGRLRCAAAFSSQESPSGYPAYKAITVNGITDIIEHRKMERLLYVTDNPAVWK